MVTWDAAADRRLLLLALKVHTVSSKSVMQKQLKGSLNYDAIASEFGVEVTLNTLRVRMCQLKKLGGPGSPEKVQTGRITKRIPC